MSENHPPRRLHDSIFRTLGLRIVSGAYPVGSYLPTEEVLREELEVSRNALREAIKVLVAKGMLTVRTRTGTRVLPRRDWHLTDPDVLAWSIQSGPDEQLLRWLTEFRSVIEPAMAELAAQRATEAERNRVVQCLADLEDACMDSTASSGQPVPSGQIQSLLESDMAFHEAISAASGNPFLISVSAHVALAMANSRQVTQRLPGAQLRAMPEHRRVAEAIAEGRPAIAREAMVRLIVSVERDLDSAFSDESEA